ncbi:hypothetical protein QTG56_21600 [Rossellomorea sp. AcN35-11]|nr:hypothetical protein [Rossellomorea aquimaris]WJV29486.1 hypothetical protein QTG56_21600 [Rossellomorea sp. AcN35-11]
MGFLFILLGGIVLFMLSNWLMGYRKEHIQIDFEERYFKEGEYIEAIRQELEQKGKDVEYVGERKFIVDGKTYLFIERNVSMGGVPLQRTILKPVNK